MSDTAQDSNINYLEKLEMVDVCILGKDLYLCASISSSDFLKITHVFEMEPAAKPRNLKPTYLTTALYCLSPMKYI